MRRRQALMFIFRITAVHARLRRQLGGIHQSLCFPQPGHCPATTDPSPIRGSHSAIRFAKGVCCRRKDQRARGDSLHLEPLIYCSFSLLQAFQLFRQKARQMVERQLLSAPSMGNGGGDSALGIVSVEELTLFLHDYRSPNMLEHLTNLSQLVGLSVTIEKKWFKISCLG